MEELVNTVANGLFSVCVTLGMVPIIKCPKDNAAEQVARVGFLIELFWIIFILF